jgi:sugar/nucleoside kinase (ribokinase family)
MTQAGDTGRAGIPDIVVVGAACRDIDESDPRGWRLGGGVTYGALACARLGIRTGVLLGVDAIATDAWEIDLLVDAGVDIIRVPLPTGPVFINHERPEGRIQTSLDPGSQLPVEAVPPAWRAAPAWMLALVANELSDAWAGQPSTDSCVALGWQGILRVLVAGERVGHLSPGPSALLARADIVGVSRHDIEGHLVWAEILDWLRPGAEVLMTAGPLGGMLLRRGSDGRITGRDYPPVPARVELDATGAGDVTLAAFVSARIAGGPAATERGTDLLLAATVGSLIVEGPGLDAVPTLSAVRRRLQARRDP